MTSEICAKCGYPKELHPIVSRKGAYKLKYPCKKFEPQNNFETPTDPINGLGWKMKSQNHSHPENTSDLVEASKCSGDTEPEAYKNSKMGSNGVKPTDVSGSGSLSDKIQDVYGLGMVRTKYVKEAVKKLKDVWCHWKECGKGSKCACCERIDKIFGEELAG